MKETTQGKTIIRGHHSTEEEQYEIICWYLRGESPSAISNIMRIDPQTAKKYIDQYVNDEDDPQLGQLELQSLKSNLPLINYVDILTIENLFSMLKDIQHQIWNDLQIDISISQILCI